MTIQDVSQIGAVADRGRAVATLTMAFSSDPIMRWLWPDAAAYLGAFPGLVAAMAGGAFDSGTADADPDIAGVGLWLPPGGVSDEETMVALFQETVLGSRQAETFDILGQMDEYHPKGTHWYLPIIGVDPSQQGRGTGSALLRHALARCDQDRLPAYLEASSERNKVLYARHGFEEIAVIQAGSSPPLWPMLRPSR
jgi:GNAT superfamily N-acetyltransferase